MTTTAQAALARMTGEIDHDAKAHLLRAASFSVATCEPSSMSRPVSVLATISPETASKLICNLCHERHFVVPCFSIRHSPGPFSSDPCCRQSIAGAHQDGASIFGKVTVGARPPSVE